MYLKGVEEIFDFEYTNLLKLFFYELTSFNFRREDSGGAYVILLYTIFKFIVHQLDLG